MPPIVVSTPVGVFSFEKNDHTRGHEITVILDRSGSMAGRNMDYAKKAISELMQTRKINSIIVFNNKANEIGAKSVDHVRACGTTNFTNAFRLACSRLQHDVLNIVLFFTDGQSDDIDTQSAIGLIQQKIVEGFDIHMNSFGIGSDADRLLLLKFAQSGFPGTIQYIETSGEIVPAVNSVCDMIDDTSSIFRILSTIDKNVAIKDFLEYDTETRKDLFKAMIQKESEKPVEELKVSIPKFKEMLELLELDLDERGTFRDMIYTLTAIATSKLSATEVVERISKSMFCVGTSKKSSNNRANAKMCERILYGHHSVARLLDPEEPLETDATDLKDPRLEGTEDKDNENYILCSITQCTPRQAQEENTVIGIGWKRVQTHSMVCIMDPRQSRISMEWVFLTVKGLWMLWNQDNANARKEGVLLNTGVVVHGIIPLVINEYTGKLLRISDAIITSGNPQAISECAPISAFLGLLDLITRDEWNCVDSWVHRAWKLLVPIGQFSLQNNFCSRVRQLLELDSHLTPDITSSLEVFMVECIIADVVNQKIVDKIFHELVRRRLNRLTENRKWKLIDFWQTQISSEACYDIKIACRQVWRNWMNNIWKHDNICLGRIGYQCVRRDDVVQKRFNIVEKMWETSRLWLMIKRYADMRNIAYTNPPEDIIDANDKFRFLVASIRTVAEIRRNQPLDTEQHYDTNLVKSVREDSMESIWMSFRDCNDRIEAIQILSLATEHQLAALRKRMRNHMYEHEKLVHYKYKFGLMRSRLNFTLRCVDNSGKVTFICIQSPFDFSMDSLDEGWDAGLKW